MMDFYRYKATVARVIDGDTVDLTVDLGFKIYTAMRIRMYGINTPELHAKDPAPGQAAKAFLEGLLPVGAVVTLDSHKDSQEKYGRFLGELFVKDGDPSVNDQMVMAGHAVRYFGGARV